MADISWIVREELLENVMFESRDLNDGRGGMTRMGKESFKHN